MHRNHWRPWARPLAQRGSAAPRVTRVGLGSEQACGLPGLHAGTPALTSAVAGPLSDVGARQLVDWPHAPGSALCSHGNSPVLAGRTKASGPRGCGPAQPQPSSTALAPYSGVGAWHKASSMLWEGALGLSSEEHLVLGSGAQRECWG